ATEDLAVAESADRDEPDPVVAALNLLSHRLGSTFAQVLSVLNQVAQLRPTFTQVTQQMQAIEQGVMTTANAAHEQTTLVAEVQQWIEMTDDLSQVLAQQALTANKAGNTATAALITGQQKMISIASEVEGFRDKSLQLTERIQGMLESIDSATQTTREHQRTANIARVLLLNASTLSIRASQKQQPEDFESLVNQFQGVSTQLQQLTEQFNQSLKQQQNQTRQAQFVVANLRRDIQSFNQSMGGFKSSIETSQSALSQSQSATQKITEAGQQMTDLSQQLAELVHTSRQTLQDMAEIARSTQNRTDLTLQQTQAVERLTQEMATMTAGFLASEG
ncbi:MAG: methyl-accepting chemotaxis protein, partial [Cyanobacteria bacterium P01_G01_bin.38]